MKQRWGKTKKLSVGGAMVEVGAMNLMSNFKVKVNTENAWLVTNLQSGLTRKFLCKADAEKYLDLQENVRPTTECDNL